MTDCPLDICNGDGWIVVVDFTGGELERCPCNPGDHPEPEPDPADGEP